MKNFPNYKEAFSRPKALKAAVTLARLGGVANFSEIHKAAGIKGSTLKYNLDILIRYNIVKSEVKGTYRLKYLTPLCYVFGNKPLPVAYVGLLGRRGERKEPETKTALKILENEGFRPESIHVLTTFEALNDWKNEKLSYEWIICYEDEISDIDSVKNKVQKRLESLMRDYVVIMDCTSATKPATIAYYELAQTYQAPLIYIYEPKLKLKWLKSKETIAKEILPSPTSILP
jgi:hypothetical protein